MLKQSRSMSLVEAIAGMVIGYLVAVLAQFAIFPLFDIHPSLSQNLWIGGAFSVVSIIRSFALRRAFEWLRVRSAYDPYEEIH
jgi:hypothetical protein